MTSRFGVMLSLAILVAVLAGPALATDGTFNDANTVANWTDANWVITGTTTGIPYINAAGDIARLAARTDGNKSVFLDTSVTLGRLYLTPYVNSKSLDLLPGVGYTTLTYDDGVAGMGWAVLGLGQVYTGNSTQRYVVTESVLNDSLVVRQDAYSRARLSGDYFGAGNLVITGGSGAVYTFDANGYYSGTTTILGGGNAGVNNSSGFLYLATIGAATSVSLTNPNAIPDKTVTLLGGQLILRADADTNWGISAIIKGLSSSSIGAGWNVGTTTLIRQHMANLTVLGDQLIGVSADSNRGGALPNQGSMLMIDGNVILTGMTNLQVYGDASTNYLTGLTINGPVSGPGSLVVGNSTFANSWVELTNNTNNYTGGTMIGATLRLGVPNALPTAGVTTITYRGTVESNDVDNTLQNDNITIRGGRLYLLGSTNRSEGGNITMDSGDMFSTIQINYKVRYQAAVHHVQSLTVNAGTLANIYTTDIYTAMLMAVDGATTLHGATNYLNLEALNNGNTLLVASGGFTTDGNLVIYGGGALSIRAPGGSWGGNNIQVVNGYIESNQSLGSETIVLNGTQQQRAGLTVFTDTASTYANNSIVVPGTGVLSVGFVADTANKYTVDFGNLTLANGSILQHTAATANRQVRINGATSISGRSILQGNSVNEEMVLNGDVAADVNSTLFIASSAIGTNQYSTAFTKNVDANFLGALWVGMSHDVGIYKGYASGYGNAYIRDYGSMKGLAALTLSRGYAGSRFTITESVADPNFNVVDAYALLVSYNDANAATLLADGNNYTGRFASTTALNLRGGELAFTGVASTVTAEGFGTANLLSGASLLTNSTVSTNGMGKLLVQNIARATGATVFFTGNFGKAAGGDQIRLIDSNVTLVNGILGGWATGSATAGAVNPTDWASYDPNIGVYLFGAARYVATLAGGESAWDANMNVRLDANQALTASRDVNSIKTTINPAVIVPTIDLKGFTLNVASGGILTNTAGTTVIADTVGGGKLTAGGLLGGELFITNNSTFRMDAVVADANTDAKVTLVKSGAGNLVLMRDNTYTGGTFINQGIVEANKPSRLGTGGVVLAGGALRVDTNYTGGGSLNFNQSVEVRDNYGLIDLGSSASGTMVSFTSLTLTDQSNLVLTTNNTYVKFTGTTSLSGGDAAVTANSANTILWLDGAITGLGTLTKYGGGKLVLTGTGSNFSGGWNVVAGSIDANKTGALGMGNGRISTSGVVVCREANVIGNTVTGGVTVSIDYGGSLYMYEPQNISSLNLAGGGLAATPLHAVYLYNDSNTNWNLNNVNILPSTMDPAGVLTGIVNNNPSNFYVESNNTAMKGLQAYIGNLTMAENTLFTLTGNATTGDDLVVTGKTTLAAGDHVFATRTGNCDIVLAGEITGSGALTKWGSSGSVVLNSGSNSYTGGTRVMQNGCITTTAQGLGCLVVRNTGDPNAMGSGDVTLLLTGFLALFSDVTAATGAPYRNNVVVDASGGNCMIFLAPSVPHKVLIDGNSLNDPAYIGVTHKFQNLTIGNMDQLIIDGNASAADNIEFAGTTTLKSGGGFLGINNGGSIILSGLVTGNGRLSLAGNGGTVVLRGAGNNYTGGTYIGTNILRVEAAGALGTGDVLVGGDRGGTLNLVAAGAANGNLIDLQGSTSGSTSAFLNFLARNVMTGSSSLLMESAILNGTPLLFGQDFTGGTTLTMASELTVRRYDLDSNMAGNPLGSGKITIDSSQLVALSDTSSVWGNDIEFKGRSILTIGNTNTGLNQTETFGALVASNQTLSPTNIVRNNGYQVAFSGLDLTGGLTISGLDLSFNRDPAKRVSILGATNLTVSADANLYIGGTADMLTDTVVDANFHLSIVNNNQVFVTGTAIHNAGNVSGPGLAASGRTNIAAGATLGVTRIRQQQVDVSGKLVLNGGSGPATSIVNALNIAGVTDAWTGLVDIRQGYLVLPSATASDVGNQVKQASNFAAFGSWDGTGGITSSSAAGDQLYGVGYADNAIAKKSEFGEANGLAYTGVLVRYTYVGDTNLDGITDLDKDYYNWSFGYLNAGNNTWYYGDFNYDGQVDLDKDYYIWSYGYLNQGSPLVGGAESAVDTSPSSAPVPEPATVGLLGLGLLGLLRRRSRKA